MDVLNSWIENWNMPLTESADESEGARSTASSLDFSAGNVHVLDINQPMPTEFMKLQSKLNLVGYVTLILSAAQSHVDTLLNKLGSVISLFPSKTAIIITNTESMNDLTKFKEGLEKLLNGKATCKVVLLVNQLKIDASDNQNINQLEVSTEANVKN